jgi:lysozyme
METRKILAKCLLAFALVGMVACSGSEKEEEEKDQNPTVDVPEGTGVGIDTSDVTTPVTTPVDTVKALGIDVSDYQKDVNWDDVKADGISFAYAQALYGITGADKTFPTNWSGMKAAGVIRGAYLFYIPTDDPTEQANAFIKIVGSLEVGDLPPVIDVETKDEAISVDQYQKDLLTLLNLVEEGLGMKPMIYTYLSFGNEYLTNPEFANYQLWISEQTSGALQIPNTWKDKGWVMWQYATKAGTVNGVPSGNVDKDKFNGNIEQLKAITKQ